MRLIYTVLFYCALPIILLRLFWRGYKAPAYRQRWFERFGYFDSDEALEKSLWIHAVSVGEVLAAKPLTEALLIKHPNITLVVTTMTPTGSDQVNRLFGEKVFHVYIPYDLPGSLKRFFAHIKPIALVIMETEIWPNTIYQCNKNSVPVILANGRLSEKSLKRYQKFQKFSTSIFRCISTIAAQSPADAKRFDLLGANRTVVTGNIKSDIVISEDLQLRAKQYRGNLEKKRDRKIVLAASTHNGEDEIILSAFCKMQVTIPNALLILVPRHPERFNDVEKLCLQYNLKTIRKSLSKPINNETNVLLGDTMGDLLMLYGTCDVSIMGGTFIEHGGHNFLEPAAWGVPIVSGSSDYNFSKIANDLSDVGALIKIESDDALLAKELKQLLSNDALRKEKGSAAKHYIESNRGALKELMKIINSFLS